MPPFSHYAHFAPQNTEPNIFPRSLSVVQEPFQQHRRLLAPFSNILSLGMSRNAREHEYTRTGDMEGAGLRRPQIPTTDQSAPSNEDVIDLTRTSSDEINEDSFISRTRHPHDSSLDRNTASNSLNQPAYGSHRSQPSTFTDIYNSITVDPNAYAPPLIMQPSRMYPPLSAEEYARRRGEEHRNARRVEENSLRERTRQRAEETAIRRQQQLHRDWRRVQDRNRRRAEEQVARETEARVARETERVLNNVRQVLSQEEERPRRAPSSTRTPTQRTSRPSTASSVSSVSEISEFSNSSTSTFSQFDKQSTNMEHIDLTTVDDDQALDQVLAKEQQDAIASQKNSQTPTNPMATNFSSYKCAICMDSPTDATTTKCGHLFCHKCIMDALKHSKANRLHEAQNYGRRANPSGLCPNCRTPLQDKDIGPSRGLIPIEIKKIPRKVYEERRKIKVGEVELTTSDKGKEKNHKPRDRGAYLKNEYESTPNLSVPSNERGQKPKGKRKRQVTDEDLDLELFGETYASSA